MKLTDRIVHELERANVPMKAKELGERLNASSGSIAMGCQRLYAHGQINRINTKPNTYERNAT